MGVIAARFAGPFGGFALDAGFEIPAAGITGLFGPSGCGKSTLLRCLAGLERMPGGALRVDGAVWQQGATFVPPWRRAAGYVFQDARLFAHLDVAANLRFGLRRAAAGGIAWDEVIDALGLGPLLARAPASLSGGERQRVALGRALLAQPRVLLLDEPLSALDRAAAEDILPRLGALSARFRVPALFVSHSIDEIERVASHLLVMRAGRITAAGPLADLLTDLAQPFAARAGAATVLDLPVTGFDMGYELSLCGFPPLCLHVPGRVGPLGGLVRLRVRASDVSLLRTAAESSILNQLPAEILAVTPAGGPHMAVVLGVGPARLLAHITRKSWDMLGLAVGQGVIAQIKAEALAAA